MTTTKITICSIFIIVALLLADLETLFYSYSYFFFLLYTQKKQLWGHSSSLVLVKTLHLGPILGKSVENIARLQLRRKEPS